MSRTKPIEKVDQRKFDAHAVAEALLEVIGNRGVALKNSRDVKTGRKTALDEIEQRLGEIAALCGFTSAEGARFLGGLTVSIGRSWYSSAHRLSDGLIEEVIPRLAQELYDYGQLRTKEN